MGLYY